jgi:hypothetical protein
MEMHPDKRRAGRAIRKARRLAREKVQGFDWQEFIRAWNLSAEIVAAGFAAIMKAWSEVVKAVSQSLSAVWVMEETPTGRNRLALTALPGAAERSEAGAHHPSHSGVQRGREAHSASRGPDVAYGWVDEAVDFGGWEDR